MPATCGPSPVCSTHYNHPTGLLRFAQALIGANQVVALVLAAAALWLAFRGELRHAIMALAAMMLFEWVSELPSLFIHGYEASASLIGLVLFAKVFVYPVIAIIAIVLAVKNEQLPIAIVLVGLPLAVTIFGVVAFAVSVMIYGF